MRFSAAIGTTAPSTDLPGMSREPERLTATQQAATSRFVTIAGTVAVLILVISSAATYRYWPSDYAYANDMSLYSLYGHRIADGQAPYRDFRLEYPPGALPLFVVPL